MKLLRALLATAALAFLPSLVGAQQSTPTPSLSTATQLSTLTTTFVRTTTAAGQPRTVTFTQTSTRTSLSVTSIYPTETPGPPELTSGAHLDPAYGVLGGLLIISGLPSAFLGHKNRWSSFFLTGFYIFSLACICLILHFGVENVIDPPNATMRGLYLLSSVVAGFVGGAASIFFYNQAKYFVGAWGGFLIGMWIQCFHDGGLIQPIGFRWILYIGCAVVGFVLCTIPKLHYKVLVISTAFVGATAFMLGVDCFTNVGLKEFYVWNLGFSGLFPQFTSTGTPFPVTQTMQIELGLIAAVAIIGGAVQLRLNIVLMHKLKQIQEEQRVRDEDIEKKAARRFEVVDRDRELWELEHGNKKAPTRIGEGSTAVNTPDLDERKTLTTLPALKLGKDVEEGIPAAFISEELDPTLKKKVELLNEINAIRKSIDVLDTERKDTHHRMRTLSSNWSMNELIQPAVPRPPRSPDPSPRIVSNLNVRASVAPPSVSGSGSGSGSGAVTRPRDGPPAPRPVSAPLRDDEWDSYVRERKLFVPPNGTTAPIESTPIPAPVPVRTHRRSMSSILDKIPPAVSEALTRRQRRESAYSLGGVPAFVEEARAAATPDSGRSVMTANLLAAPINRSDDDIPISQVMAGKKPQGDHRHKRSSSFGSILPNILPPRKSTSTPSPAPSPVTRTFEELQERHTEKLREMQEPTTAVVVERAELQDAKERWERRVAYEREVMAKREKEKAAMLFKESERRLAEKKHMEEQERSGKGRTSVLMPAGTSAFLPTLSPSKREKEREKRSSSGERPNSTVLPTKRISSNVKVQQWQKYQAAEEDAARTRARSPGPSAGPSRTQDPSRSRSSPRDEQRSSSSSYRPSQPQPQYPQQQQVEFPHPSQSREQGRRQSSSPAPRPPRPTSQSPHPRPSSRLVGDASSGEEVRRVSRMGGGQPSGSGMRARDPPS